MLEKGFHRSETNTKKMLLVVFFLLISIESGCNSAFLTKKPTLPVVSDKKQWPVLEHQVSLCSDVISGVEQNVCTRLPALLWVWNVPSEWLLSIIPGLSWLTHKRLEKKHKSLVSNGIDGNPERVMMSGKRSPASKSPQKVWERTQELGNFLYSQRGRRSVLVFIPAK